MQVLSFLFLHIMVMILLLSQHIFYSGFYLYFCIAIVCSVKLAWEPEEPVRSCIILHWQLSLGPLPFGLIHICELTWRCQAGVKYYVFKMS